MATAPPPQIIVIEGGGGGKSTPLEKIQTLAIIGGLGLGGYVVYEMFFSPEDPCSDNGILGKSGLLGQFNIFAQLGFNPVCEIKNLLESITNLADVGAGVPVELEDCPEGWTNDGLTCREPISCGEGWDFFTEGCSGGNVRGRLDNGGKCPDHHPEYVDGLCYRPCPAGYSRVAGMPYVCSPN